MKTGISCERLASLLLLCLALTACQMSSPAVPLVTGVQPGRMATGREGLTPAAAAMIDFVVDRYTFASDRQGMAGVIAAIDECYLSAIAPGKRPQDVRNCLVLDMLAFRIDQHVSGGPPGNDRQLPFFQRARAAQRWERYAPLGNLRPGEDAASFMMNGSDAAAFELERRRRAPRMS